MGSWPERQWQPLDEKGATEALEKKRNYGRIKLILSIYLPGRRTYIIIESSQGKKVNSLCLAVKKANRVLGKELLKNEIDLQCQYMYLLLSTKVLVWLLCRPTL